MVLSLLIRMNEEMATMISRIPPPASTNRVVLILVIVCLSVTFTGAALVTTPC